MQIQLIPFGEATRNTVVDEAADERMKASSFSHDEGPGYYYSRLLDEKGIARDSDKYLHAFEYALMWLLDNRPFYAHIFYDVVRRRTHKIKTLCVLIINARIELWYNPDFLALHRLKHNVGFLQHEAGHLLAGHLGEKKRMKGHMPPYLDVATDLSVDTLIQAPGDQPDWVLLPKDLRVPKEGKDPSMWARAEEGRRWTYYQKLLVSGDPMAQFMEKLLARPVPDEDTIRSVVGEQGAASGSFGSFDDHSQWEKGDEADVQDQVVGTTIKKAYAKSGGTMRGYMSGALVGMIEDKLKDKSVPFERIVRAFAGGHLKIGHKATPMRPSKRRCIPPGRTFKRGLDILYTRDDSGSMADEEVALGTSEMHNLCLISGVRVRFQRFCCALVGDLIDLDQAKFSEVMSRGSGGTDFNAVIDLAHELKPDLMFIMTDGQAPLPRRKPPCPMAWLLTHDGTGHEWGTIIRLPTIEDIRRGYRAVIERWAPK